MRHLMNQTFEIYRLERIYDGQGGYKEEPVYSHELRGRIRPATARERIAADQLGAEVSHVVYCMNDQDIRRGDLLRFNNREVEIIAVREPSQPHHFECDAREVQSRG